MRIERAEHEKMSPSGSALLRSLQNNKLPVLDLFVREAIQNSLDAAIDSDEYDSVIVDMGTREINVPSLAKHFEGISDVLISRFNKGINKSIYISDSNTTGLTGELDYRKGLQKAGNIYKLIYGINIPQEKEGAGGSWGLGKTIYFRLGIGLVIFYTRIQKENGQYEERLAATLVENEKDPNSLLYNDSEWSRGIAWWGQELEEGSHQTIPITQTEEIYDILHALNIEPFRNTETGTKVIIPFIKDDLCSVSEGNNDAWWEESIDSYIKIAVQRWYSPRLNNPVYPYGKWLDFRINGQKLTRSDMACTFSEVQLLYNLASSPKTLDEINELQKKGYHLKDVHISSNVLDNSKKSAPNAGRIAFKKYSRKELNMTPPHNEASPFEYINIENISDSMNSPIVTYLRKPGMLINYEVGSDWCGQVEVNKDEFLLAIFVPNSNTKLKSNDIPNLEEYLRKSEEADHASWCNIPVGGKNTRIVSSIQNYTRKALAEKFSQRKKLEIDFGTTMMAKKFGKVLLPPKGFGKRMNGPDTQNKKKDNPPNATPSRLDSFAIKSQQYDNEGNLIVTFDLKTTKKINQTIIELIVQSESGVIKADNWEDPKSSIGTEFPIQIKKLEINELENDECNIAELIEKQISFIQTKNHNVKNGLIINNNRNPLKLKGQLVLIIKDPFVQFSITHKFEEGHVYE